MSVWIEIVVGVILSLAIIGAIFWYTFRRMPERRSDDCLIQHEAAYYTSSDDGNGDHSA